MIFHAPLSKLYVNTMLAILNARVSLRNDMTGNVETTSAWRPHSNAASSLTFETGRKPLHQTSLLGAKSETENIGIDSMPRDDRSVSDDSYNKV